MTVSVIAVRMQWHKTVKRRHYVVFTQQAKMDTAACVISACERCLCDAVDDYNSDKNVRKKCSYLSGSKTRASASSWSNRPEVYTR